MEAGKETKAPGESDAPGCVPLLNTDQVAELVGIAPETVRGWRRKTKRGRPMGPPWVVLDQGRSVRYRPSDVAEWIAAQQPKRAVA